MNKLCILVVALLSLFITADRAWADEELFDFTVRKITHNVYSIISPYYGRPTADNKGWNSNSHFVITRDGVLVFDTGSSENIGKGILRSIRKYTDKPVRWIINSHSHADHWLGNGAFPSENIEIIASKSTAETMKKDGQRDVNAFRRMTEGATGDTQLVYPTRYVKEGEKAVLGNLNVEFIFSNDGHSPGDLMLWLPDQKVILGGDVLSSEWLPIMTHHGNLPNLIETLNRVVELNPTVVLPGHGEPTTVDSPKRDVLFLTSVLKMVDDGRTTGLSSDEIVTGVKQHLGPKYAQFYRDFESSSGYLVSMIFKEQDKLH